MLPVEALLCGRTRVVDAACPGRVATRAPGPSTRVRMPRIRRTWHPAQEKRTNAVLEAVEAELAAGQPLTPADIQARCAGVEALTLDDPGVEAATLAFDRGDWQVVQQRAGVASGASGCRLGWVNGLRPGLRHDAYEPEEDAALADAVARLGVHQVRATGCGLRRGRRCL